jgi:hypothetical protein
MPFVQRRTLLLIGVVLLVGAWTGTGCAGPSSTTVTATGVVYEVIVPAGTYEEVNRGTLIDLLPPIINAKVGDEFVVINEDKVTHIIGPFSVRPGETVRHIWAAPAIIQGECTVLVGDQVQIIVTA